MRDLDILLKSKRIKAVEPQVTFELYGKNGTRIFKHIVDFLVTLNDGMQKVMEAKGEESDIWKAKMKLFRDNYPHIEYLVVKRENINYGPLIDLPATPRPVPPNNYEANVKTLLENMHAQ